MNDALKYKLDNKGIAAFVVGVLLMCLISYAVYRDTFVIQETSRNVMLEVIVLIVAALFGTRAGVLTAFIGVICATVACGYSVVFSDAIAFSILAIIIGWFADRYGIRENGFTIKNMVLFNLTHIMALISAFIFVKPLLDHIIYENKSLYVGVENGIKVGSICALFVGAILTILFFLLSKLIAYVKS